jgi:orotate phosphoribosyltransferase-like protein
MRFPQAASQSKRCFGLLELPRTCARLACIAAFVQRAFVVDLPIAVIVDVVPAGFPHAALLANTVGTDVVRFACRCANVSAIPTVDHLWFSRY